MVYKCTVALGGSVFNPGYFSNLILHRPYSGAISRNSKRGNTSNSRNTYFADKHPHTRVVYLCYKRVPFLVPLHFYRRVLCWWTVGRDTRSSACVSI